MHWPIFVQQNSTLLQETHPPTPSGKQQVSKALFAICPSDALLESVGGIRDGVGEG